MHPVLLQAFHGQPFEQITFTLEIHFHRGNQKTLPEPSRAAEKIIFASGDKIVYLIRLVHIYITSVAEILEILDTYRVKHNSCFYFAGHGIPLSALPDTNLMIFLQYLKQSGNISLISLCEPDSNMICHKQSISPQ